VGARFHVAVAVDSGNGVASLRNNGALTAAQYEETLKERQAAGAVDLALNPEWMRKKQALERGR
jgi:hypothetical protein